MVKGACQKSGEPDGSSDIDFFVLALFALSVEIMPCRFKMEQKVEH